MTVIKLNITKLTLPVLLIKEFVGKWSYISIGFCQKSNEKVLGLGTQTNRKEVLIQIAQLKLREKEF